MTDKTMIHGANIFKYAEDGDILDFSSNINPLGPPDYVYDIIEENVKSIERYPDIEYRSLMADISKAFGVAQNKIAIGNGAIELIDRIIFEHERIIVFDPSFSEYEIRARVYGKEFLPVNLKNDFTIDFEALEKFAFKKGDLLILTNPNNPNGRALKRDEFERLIAIIKGSPAYLMLDQAFDDFADLDYQAMDYIDDDIYLIKAATKFYSLPGLRLGMAFSSEKNIKRLRSLVPSWSVGALLENMGKIFMDQDFKEKSKAYIKMEREFLIDELEKLKLKTYESAADFLLINLGGREEEDVFQEFLKRKILVRKCSSYRNLEGNFIRVAIKDHEKNTKLIQVLEEIING